MSATSLRFLSQNCAKTDFPTSVSDAIVHHAYTYSSKRMRNFVNMFVEHNYLLT